MPRKPLSALPVLPAPLRQALAKALPADAGPAGSMVVTAAGDNRVELLIYGNIGTGWWDEESVTAKSVVEQLKGLAPSQVDVRINSYGGSVSDGVAIHNELRRHAQAGTRINVTVDGAACSIASLIAVAGDTVTMPSNTLLMLHAPWGGLYVEGNAKLVREVAEEFASVLETFGHAMAQSYARKTGRSAQDFIALWDTGKDYWYTAKEALAAGLCDVVLDDSDKEQSARAALRELTAQPSFQKLAAGMPTSIAAGVRFTLSEDGIGREDISMAADTGTPPSGTVTAQEREAIVAAERNRVFSIREMARGVENREDAAVFANLRDRAISEGWSEDKFGQLMLKEMGKDSGPLNGGGHVENYSNTGRPGGSDFKNAAAEMLAVRGGLHLDKLSPAAQRLANCSVSEIAQACLPASERGKYNNSRAIIRAALSTSDFPAILENAMYKSLRQGYEDEPGTHTAWVRGTTVPDFKDQSRVLLGSMPELSLIPEGGEYPMGSVDEDKSVPFRVAKFGVIVPITYEALVNDDLDALGRIPIGLGMSARRKEADLVYSLFDGAGQVMQDGQPLFDAAHANVTASAADLDEDSLAAARLLLRKQTALGGGQLNLTPRFLIVPPELESKAEKLIAASSIYVASGIESATPQWIRNLSLVVENRLPATAFYLAAAPTQIDTVELAYLDDDSNFGDEYPVHARGARGPRVEHHDEFNRDVRNYKVRSSMGARAIDWRGMVKTPLT